MNNFSKAGLDHSEARTDEQRELMKKIEEDGVCPFCAEYFTKYHPKPIIKETASWFLTENMSPYEGTKHHFLFVYKTSHATKPTEVTDGGQAELFSLMNWAIEEYNIEGGSFFMRFGGGGYTGSSVEHLHAHLLVGAERTESSEGLRVKLGYKK